MNVRRHLPLCALVLSSSPRLAAADDAPTVAWTERRVQEALLGPMAAYEDKASRFSRARLPPTERRVRVLQRSPSADPSGRAYMAFAIDDRYGSTWREGALVGCAYVKSGELFVKVGATHRAAAFFLGKRSGPVSGVCEEAQAS